MGTLDDLFRRFEHLNDIGASLSNESDLNRLLEKIVLAAKSITRADGGTLYLLSEDKRHLHFEIVRTDSLNIAFGGTSGNPVSGKFPDLPLYRADGSANDTMVAAFAAISGKTVNIADAYAAKGFDFSGTRSFDERTGYRSQSFLTVPMRNHEGEIIGVLQLINAHMPKHDVVVPFSEADQRLAESLASQAAIALTNRQLLRQLEALFESFIQLINSAIDDKSPYTGEHCQRVPKLTMMLAEAAHETTEGPLADFRLTDRDRYELRIAALLHDCGKVTTPVHVVDKATKLQTIFDRIELIDTRFELLRRDAEIRMLRQIAQGAPKEQAEAEFREFEAKMAVDRNLLHTSNIGSERMSDDDIERVKEMPFANKQNLSYQDIAKNRNTLENVRLWDWRPLKQTYKQLQELKPYYFFNDVDVDRYTVDGTQRQVLVSVREMNVGRLADQAQTWVNQHLVYTPGYALLVRPVHQSSGPA